MLVYVQTVSVIISIFPTLPTTLAGGALASGPRVFFLQKELGRWWFLTGVVHWTWESCSWLKTLGRSWGSVHSLGVGWTSTSAEITSLFRLECAGHFFVFWVPFFQKARNIIKKLQKTTKKQPKSGKDLAEDGDVLAGPSDFVGSFILNLVLPEIAGAVFFITWLLALWRAQGQRLTWKPVSKNNMNNNFLRKPWKTLENLRKLCFSTFFFKVIFPQKQKSSSAKCPPRLVSRPGPQLKLLKTQFLRRTFPVPFSLHKTCCWIRSFWGLCRSCAWTAMWSWVVSVRFWRPSSWRWPRNVSVSSSSMIIPMAVNPCEPPRKSCKVQKSGPATSRLVVWVVFFFF